MSYQVLARKWRPRQFNEVIGQPHVVDALSHALTEQRLHHAYLFTGTRGIGKTTIARIFAKSLNCEQGISANPCEQCINCIEISQGSFIDLIEVDAASRTKVEDTRELLDNVQYAPSRGRYKVYLIDEVHMLSGHSFNALLKTLEEPPAHVIFLLATTDPQKLPITVLSRCLQFHLKNMSEAQIVEQLKAILQKEQITFEDEALKYMANAANGSMRDALSLLDQAIAHGQGQVITEKVLAMLGCIDKKYTVQFIIALHEQDGKALIDLCQEIAALAADYQQVLTDLLHTLTEIALLQTVPNAVITDESQRDILTKLANEVPKENIQLYYQIALIGNKDLSFAPALQTGFTMLMLRMLSFTPNITEVDKPVQQAVSHAQQGTTQQKQSKVTHNIVESTNIQSDSTKAAAKPIDSTSLQWDELINQLDLQGSLKILANHCVAKVLSNTKVHLCLEASQAPLLTPRNKTRLQEALSHYFKGSVALEITTTEAPISSPSNKLKIHNNEKAEKARISIEKDHNVQAILKTFNAKIDTDSIKTKT